MNSLATAEHESADFLRLVETPHWVVEDGRRTRIGEVIPLITNPKAPRLVRYWHPIAPPRPANDNGLVRKRDRRPGETFADWRMRLRSKETAAGDREPQATPVRWPLQIEFDAKRVPLNVMEIADDVLRYWDTAHRPAGGTSYKPKSTPRDALIGVEHTAHAAGIVSRMRQGAGHLWPAAVAAAVHWKEMREIGEMFGASKDSAPAVGRNKATDGLLFAGRALRELAAEVAENNRRHGLT
jgi:hypothetical protein